MPINNDLRATLVLQEPQFFSSLLPRTLLTCSKIAQGHQLNWLDRFGADVLPTLINNYNKEPSLGLKKWIILCAYQATVRIATVINTLASLIFKIEANPTASKVIFYLGEEQPKEKSPPSQPKEEIQQAEPKEEAPQTKSKDDDYLLRSGFKKPQKRKTHNAVNPKFASKQPKPIEADHNPFAALASDNED